MRLTAQAIGPVVDLGKPRSGWVHSVFAHAVNLQLGDELWTVVPRGGHDGALTVRLIDAVLPGDMGLRAYDPVWVRSRYVRVGPAVIDARTAVRWIPRAYSVDLHGAGLHGADLHGAGPHGLGERVAVMGLGLLGLLTVQIASAAGCPVSAILSRVVASSSAATTSAAMRRRSSIGMSRGPSRPRTGLASKEGKPASTTVGMSGAIGDRTRSLIAMILILPVCA